MDRTLVRTQVSLFENQRQYLKMAADLATWRLQNDPYADDTEGLNTSTVSMAEVLRHIVDAKMWARARGGDQRELWSGPDPIEADDRSREIQHALMDVMDWNRARRPNPMEEFPDSRSQGSGRWGV